MKEHSMNEMIEKVRLFAKEHNEDYFSVRVEYYSKPSCLEDDLNGLNYIVEVYINNLGLKKGADVESALKKFNPNDSFSATNWWAWYEYWLKPVSESKFACDFAEWVSKYYNMVKIGGGFMFEYKNNISRQYFTIDNLQKEFLKTYKG
jgi:hypothetical protein